VSPGRGVGPATQSPYLQPHPNSNGVLEQQTLHRVARLCRQAIATMQIDLSDVRVLTEAATGPFAVSPVLAAMAGAHDVVAVGRDSRWGSAQDAFDQVRVLARHCGVEDSIRLTAESPVESANGCDLVTNLGFVRPISRPLIERLSPTAAVSLMWEPWEMRPHEIDTDALRECGVALVATNEQHPNVRTFDYLGPTVGRLLLEAGIEIVNAYLLVLGNDPFGFAIARWLANSGATVTRQWPDVSTVPLDALVIAEHRSSDSFPHPSERSILDNLASNGTPIIRLCGLIDPAALAAAGIAIYPTNDVAAGVMTVTTAYAGPRPVIDLHAAGLKAGGDVVRARQSGASIDQAVAAAVENGFALAVMAEAGS
jgi:hypothetical protein